MDFEKATFSGSADFTSVNFTDAVFTSVRFLKLADFEKAKFTRVSFSSAAFLSADFLRTEFRGPAHFDSATFQEEVDFNEARFAEVGFEASVFSGSIRFTNAKFGGSTIFANARFETCVPDFRGATMHEATEWHGVTWPDPPSKQNAQEQVYAYERLKQEMERLKKHEDELTFFRKELRARRGLFRVFSGGWLLNFAYQALSAYGNSIRRPLLCLIGVFAMGVAAFARMPLFCGAPMPFDLAAKLSFANIFVFLPDKREIMMDHRMVDCLSNTTQAINAVQSLLGVMLLFLLGLALRNRFRMR